MTFSVAGKSHEGIAQAMTCDERHLGINRNFAAEGDIAAAFGAAHLARRSGPEGRLGGVVRLCRLAAGREAIRRLLERWSAVLDETATGCSSHCTGRCKVENSGKRQAVSHVVATGAQGGTLLCTPLRKPCSPTRGATSVRWRIMGCTPWCPALRHVSEARLHIQTCAAGTHLEQCTSPAT